MTPPGGNTGFTLILEAAAWPLVFAAPVCVPEALAAAPVVAAAELLFLPVLVACVAVFEGRDVTFPVAGGDEVVPVIIISLREPPNS